MRLGYGQFYAEKNLFLQLQRSHVLLRISIQSTDWKGHFFRGLCLFLNINGLCSGVFIRYFVFGQGNKMCWEQQEKRKKDKKRIII